MSYSEEFEKTIATSDALNLKGSKEPTSSLFKFEEEFMSDTIRCIPMMVRFKLDACGIKLQLKEWNLFTIKERNQLMEYPARNPNDVLNYRKQVEQLILAHTGGEATELTIESNPGWIVNQKIPETVEEKLKEFSWNLSHKEWQSLNDLQRFTLIKLSRPSHENKNFPKAIKEFGLVK
jgi:hypothetical protein